MLVKSWRVERSSVWSAVLPLLVPCHLLKVKRFAFRLKNCNELPKVAGSKKKYLVEDIYLKGSKSTKSPKQDTLLRRKKKGLNRITTSAGQYIDK